MYILYYQSAPLPGFFFFFLCKYGNGLFVVIRVIYMYMFSTSEESVQCVVDFSVSFGHIPYNVSHCLNILILSELFAKLLWSPLVWSKSLGYALPGPSMYQPFIHMPTICSH